QAFEEEKSATSTQGSEERPRLTDRMRKIWREMMQRKLLAAPALTGLVALPVAGFTAFYLLQETTPVLRGELQAVGSSLPRRERTANPGGVVPAAPSSPPAAVSQAEVSREAGDVIGQGA